MTGYVGAISLRMLLMRRSLLWQQVELEQASTRLALAEEAMEGAGATALAERDAFWRGELARSQQELNAARTALQVLL